MSEHDDDSTDETRARAREDERIRQLILARRNRFMAAALTGAGVVLNGCWDSSTGGGGGASGQAGAAGESGSGGDGVGGTSGTSGVGGVGGVAGPSACLSIDPCSAGQPVPPCVCLEAPFDAGTDSGGDEDAGTLPPSVCLTPAE